MLNFSRKIRLVPATGLFVLLLLVNYSFFNYEVSPQHKPKWLRFKAFATAKSAHSKTVLNPRKDFSTFFEANEVVRSEFLAKRAANMFGNDGKMSLLLWGPVYVWQYYPPMWTCPHLLQRVGSPSDGGKWVCGLELFEGGKFKDEKCVVYSIGVAGESSFENEILDKTNCEIFAYDHTVKEFPLKNQPRVKFRSIGLGGGNKNPGQGRFQSLKEMMKENGHSWIDFLKMDIEGAEFEVLPNIAEDFATWPFGHLNLEVHLRDVKDGGDGESAEFKRFNNLWMLMEEQGLRAFTWEDNMPGTASRRNDLLSFIGLYWKPAKPTLMEYSFLNVQDKRNKLTQF